MTLLQEIGFDKHSPSETILTTFDKDGNPNASAIGVWKENDAKIKLRLFAGTQTYQNVQNKRVAAINITSDSIFLIKQGLPEIFSAEEREINFKKARKIDAPYLAKADVIIEFEIEEMSEKTITDRIGTSKMAEIIGSVENIVVKNTNPRPFKRSELYLIESAVLATRVIEARKKGQAEISEEIVEEIKYFKEKCEKIAPKSKELRTIVKILDFFKKNKSGEAEN